jgi:hypothetical protein
MGETAVTNPLPAAPSAVDKFMSGTKVWLSPSTIGAEFTALTAAAKLDMVGTLTSPRALGFLLVPAAAILALFMWSGAAKRRRAKNPRRRRAAVRRRNPRRRVARGRRRNARGDLYGTYVWMGGRWNIVGRAYSSLTEAKRNAKARHARDGSTYAVRAIGIPNERPLAIFGRLANPKRRRNAGANAGRKRTARRRAGGGVGYHTKPGGVAAAKTVRRWKSSKAGKRSKSRGTHRVKNSRGGTMAAYRASIRLEQGGKVVSRHRSDIAAQQAGWKLVRKTGRPAVVKDYYGEVYTLQPKDA